MEKDPCEGCWFWHGARGWKYCDYLAAMGVRRPCPSGEQCTVKTAEAPLPGMTPPGDVKDFIPIKIPPQRGNSKISYIEVTRLWRDGRTVPEMAAAFSVAVETVRQAHRKLGLTPNPALRGMAAHNDRSVK